MRTPPRSEEPLISLLLSLWVLALVVTGSLYAGVVAVQSVQRVLRSRQGRPPSPARV